MGSLSQGVALGWHVCAPLVLAEVSGPELALQQTMILKHKDDVAPHLAELEQLAKIPSLTKAQREAIDDELWLIRAGAKGERDAAYHIDFGWKDGTHSAVIHDLRLDYGGRVVQIDHLILTRTLDCHVIESKGFGGEVRVSEAGEWEARTRYGQRGIPSPVEQNRRHIEVLSAFIRDHHLAPKHLGLPLALAFHNWVLVSPHCKLQRQGDGWDLVVKMDMFERQFFKRLERQGFVETVAAATRLVSLATVETFAQSLVRAHQPSTIDFAAKFGIKVPDGGDDARFAAPDPALGKRSSTQPPGCDGCGAELEQKVVAFCRFNSKRFGGRKLCRACQSAPTSETRRAAIPASLMNRPYAPCSSHAASGVA